ncbi:hypothetical protein TPHA_0B04010 [Tetrapisispora phaffii CBS 4417]|uniref:T6SS Phospholipase effector Tle1-like catalytic domain-containing protein n=1 Tax=Tetrapisispora phaffii (strain ATCC 24235 / CBS 4417 / NBRC 1672 / NRRL Y-8282 / UCD 70-5) TaxID=1071381 RepID=G8BPZ2_TETPH|nr:hypothetical protein TPHA_0B04010 [Tetrapisispora phaffii CBS 4417]CCE62073.1 hypothetical protein TPHA_0B04010 [Tetrapisispora phaffii CBS 4417]
MGDKNKNIILCFDGTLENFGAQPFTNVLKIYQMLDTSDKSKQVCYYQPGIGTSADFDQSYHFKRILTGSYIKNIVDAMFAFSLASNIKKVYQYLMKHWNYGDRIYMFGFSRGAFIARVLAGMLERVGLLNEGLEHLIDMAWNIYSYWESAEQPTIPNYTLSIVEEFKRTFCTSHPIEVHFQGLFDSVNSVGIIRDRSFPYTQRSNIVNHIRHALAIDERRGKFKQQNFEFDVNHQSHLISKYRRHIYVKINSESWNASSNKDKHTMWDVKSRGHFQSTTRSLSPFLPPTDPLSSSKLKLSKTLELPNKLMLNLSIYSSSLDPISTKVNVEGNFIIAQVPRKKLENKYCPDLVEKWFSGDHADIGGSWAINCKTQELVSTIPLRWMLAEAITFGVNFKDQSIHKFDEETSTINSILTPINDCLRFAQKKHLPKLFIDTQNDLNLDTNIPGSSEQNINQLKRDLQKGKNIKRTKEELLKHMFNISCGSISKPMILLWWCLEYVPIGNRIITSEGRLKTIFIPNLGRTRDIPESASLHWSVYWRIKYDPNYRPNNLPTYVKNILYEFEGIRFGKKNQNYYRSSMLL